MSMKDYVSKREYIVTLKNFEDLDAFYAEMQDYGKFDGSCAPIREVECVDQRPASRNTHYLLTDWEADELREDIRVKSVELHPRYKGISAGEFASTKTQTSSNWNKSSSTSNNMLNFALLRCTEEQNRVGWGSDATQNATGTVRLSATGKNVDIVVVDGDGVVLNHPEYAVNADGTGGTRFVQYNWYQHDPVVKGTSAGNYSYASVSGHATHTTGTCGGSTQGWARDANLYNIYYLAGDGANYNFPYVMDYVREFHRTKSINPATGRKNPTITNNSWGMSIFPGEWSFSDITAVTYRGTRYTPEGGGSVTYTGYSGVCTSNARLATLAGEENFGNRISTTGPYTPPSGSILTKPASWTQEGQQASLTVFSQPDASYELTIDGPADINLIHNIAMDAVSGVMELDGTIVVRDQSNNIIHSYSDTATTVNGGTIEIDIRQNSISLPNDQTYTVTYETTIVTDGQNITYATAMSLTVITESTPATATVSTITNSLLGAASLSAAITPTVGNNDDGYWTLSLPFNITYLGNSYNTIYVGTNHYITFTAGSLVYSSLGPSNPNLPKIMWSCADNSVQRIYYGAEGTAPNRTYRVRVEGNGGTTGTLGSPNMVCEWVFYEATPTQIDLQLGANNRKTTSGGGFTTQQLNDWGFIAGQRIPVRVAALDADIEDAIAEGIMYVGAAGNGLWKHDIPGGADWNNTFEMNARYPGQVYYYMRGSSPTANDTTSHPDGTYEIPNICVGAIDVTATDQKSYYSDCGPGVDIWAPGTNIISSYNSGVSDSRNSSYLLGKISGTSMASPQVCGVLACALELNPHWTQVQAKAYITGIAKQNQVVGTSGGPADIRDLQGAANKYLYYRNDRPESGQTVPKNTQGVRPTTGLAWPRPKIYRYGSS